MTYEQKCAIIALIFGQMGTLAVTIINAWSQAKRHAELKTAVCSMKEEKP